MEDKLKVKNQAPGPTGATLGHPWAGAQEAGPQGSLPPVQEPQGGQLPAEKVSS